MWEQINGTHFIDQPRAISLDNVDFIPVEGRSISIGMDSQQLSIAIRQHIVNTWIERKTERKTNLNQ